MTGEEFAHYRLVSPESGANVPQPVQKTSGVLVLRYLFVHLLYDLAYIALALRGRAKQGARLAASGNEHLLPFSDTSSSSSDRRVRVS